jgi:hypothetical protein
MVLASPAVLGAAVGASTADRRDQNRPRMHPWLPDATSTDGWEQSGALTTLPSAVSGCAESSSQARPDQATLCASPETASNELL